MPVPLLDLAQQCFAHRFVQTQARLREGRDVYPDGGFVDVSREFPRRVCPGTADIALPA